MNKLKITIRLCKSLFSLALIYFVAGCAPSWQIRNPYRGVDWQKHQQYKANLHSHTMVRGGWMNPQSVVEVYRNLDYRILAITEHFAVIYPWEAFSKFEPAAKSLQRIKDKTPKPDETTAMQPDEAVFKNVNPAEIGMTAIQGNEVSFKGHDINSFFSDYNGLFSDGTLDTIAVKGGLVVLNHPGRYKFPVDWYVDLYQRYRQLVGIEVFNCGNRYPHDRQKWDSLLTALSPDRPVWGFSNDDLHSLRDLGRNWNVMVLPEQNEKWVRRAMEEGFFYFVNAPVGHKGIKPPEIHSITVNNKKRCIQITAAGADSIIWISQGHKIGKGETLYIKTKDVDKYVRAELYGAGNAIVCTQPFMIKK